MKKFKLIWLTLFILSILITITGCSQQANTPPETKKQAKSLPPVIKEIENNLIQIMGQIDLIPYYKKQIKDKEKKEAEQKSSAKKESGGKQSPSAEAKQFKPKPITINDILLRENLKREQNYQKEKIEKNVPDDILFIWSEINTKINGLHDKWNELETELVKGNVSSETINSFEKTLNDLTDFAANYDYMKTLVTANKLTSYIPEFINNFEYQIPPSLRNSTSELL